MSNFVTMFGKITIKHLQRDFSDYKHSLTRRMVNDRSRTTWMKGRRELIYIYVIRAEHENIFIQGILLRITHDIK